MAQGQRGELFSWKVTAESERRSYFFNVKENRKGDRFLTIVESTKQPTGEWERHQLFVYEEDIAEFLRGLERASEHLKKRPEHNRPEKPRPGREGAKPARRAFRKSSGGRGEHKRNEGADDR